MLKQILLTALFVAVIYATLLFLNYELLSEDRVTWSDYEEYTERLFGVGVQKASVDDPKGLVKSSVSVSDQGSKELGLIGVSRRVSLYPTDLAIEEIAHVWREFEEADNLVRKANWVNDSTTVYALYNDFSNDLSSAELTVGYEIDGDLAKGLVLPTGKSLKYEFNNEDGGTSSQAWNSIELGDSLLEQYLMKSDGTILPQNVTVIK